MSFEKGEAMALNTAIRHLQRGDWQKAHAIVQNDSSDIGCWAHGIAHLLEGDLGNARYWYRRAGRPFPRERDASAEIVALVALLKERTTGAAKVAATEPSAAETARAMPATARPSAARSERQVQQQAPLPARASKQQR